MLRDEWGFKRFDAYFDSGYRRSIETLDLILRALPTRERRQADRCSHLDLRERDTGYPFLMTACEGDTFFPWWREYEEMVGPIYSRPPGGESIADAWQRVHMFLNSMRRSRAGDDVLIVTHGRIMLGFKYWMERHPACDVNRLYKERSRIRNCEAWWYRYDIDARRYVHIRRLVPPGVWAKK
jgi:broad specificity phosphatase PhoE